MINKQELLNALLERFNDTEYQTYRLFLVIYNLIKDFPEDENCLRIKEGTLKYRSKHHIYYDVDYLKEHLEEEFEHLRRAFDHENTV